MNFNVSKLNQSLKMRRDSSNRSIDDDNEIEENNVDEFWVELI